MSREKPPNVHAKSVGELERHLKGVEERIKTLSTELCAAVYVDSIEEARFLFDLMRNDAHVLELRDERNELEFLLRRQKDLGIDIAAFQKEAES